MWGIVKRVTYSHQTILCYAQRNTEEILHAVVDSEIAGTGVRECRGIYTADHDGRDDAGSLEEVLQCHLFYNILQREWADQYIWS